MESSRRVFATMRRGGRKKNRVAYPHPRRAENLELALFMCPSCSSVSTMKSSGGLIYCASCGYSREFDEFGRFAPVVERRDGRQKPDASAWHGASTSQPSTVPEWDAWQRKAFREYVVRATGNPDAPPLLDVDGVRFSRGWRMEKMKEAGTGRLVLRSDRLDFIPESGSTLSFPVSIIEGPGVLKKNLLEFYVEKSVYRARFPELCHSGRSWASALEILAGISAGGA